MTTSLPSSPPPHRSTRVAPRSSRFARQISGQVPVVSTPPGTAFASAAFADDPAIYDRLDLMKIAMPAVQKEAERMIALLGWPGRQEGGLSERNMAGIE